MHGADPAPPLSEDVAAILTEMPEILENVFKINDYQTNKTAQLMEALPSDTLRGLRPFNF